MKNMILDVRYFGLGDSLAFSTLPERCHENSIDFYLYEQTKQHFKPDNNPEIFDLVWKYNPYFKGFSKEEINAGNIYKSSDKSTKSIVWQFEELHGFIPKNHYPKIYCKLENIKELENSVVIDLNSYHFYKQYCNKKIELRQKVNEVLVGLDTKEIYYIQVIKYLSKLNDINKELLPEFSSLYVNSLFHYASIIFSCKYFITVNSGGNSLSSAVKQDNETPIIHTILPDEKYSSYCFKNINYHTI